MNEENKRLKFAEETILLQIENLNNEKDLLFISGNDLCSLCSSTNEGGWYRIG